MLWALLRDNRRFQPEPPTPAPVLALLLFAASAPSPLYSVYAATWHGVGASQYGLRGTTFAFSLVAMALAAFTTVALSCRRASVK